MRAFRSDGERVASALGIPHYVDYVTRTMFVIGLCSLESVFYLQSLL